MMDENKKLFFLTGFMGCGKSYVGKSVANSLNLVFEDMDTLIEKKAGQSINLIFETKGTSHFRELERVVLNELIEDLHTQPKLIATGGGAPCFYNNMEQMNAFGVTFYLKCTPTLLQQRLVNERFKRPLLAKHNEVSLLNFIEDKLLERAPFYEQSIHTIEITDNSDEPAQRIESILCDTYMICH